MGEYEEKAVRERRSQVLIGELQGLAPDVVALNEANELPRYGRRLGEARKMLAFIERVAGDRPAILLGDFNALPDSEEIAMLLQAGFVDAFAVAGSDEGITWDEERNANIQLQRRTYPEEIPQDPRNKRIDYVFVRSSGLSVTRAMVVLDRPIEGLYPSDHFGVLVKIAVR